VRWEAWPALLGTLAWAFLLGALLATYDPGAPLAGLSLLVIAGVPLGFCLRQLVVDWQNAERSGLLQRAAAPVPPGWLQRLVLGVALVLLLGAVIVDLLTQPSSFDVRWLNDNRPLTVTNLLPGTGEALAYLAALGLTLALVANPTRGPARPLWLSAASLGAAAVLGAVLLVIAAGSRVDAAGMSGNQTSCQHPDIGVGVPPQFDGVIVAHADGELDGRSLGTVDIRPREGTNAGVEFDTVWGSGTAKLDSNQLLMFVPDPVGLANLALWIFHSDETIVADDLGIDLVGGAPLRHCSLVIDGGSAVLGFEALRWLTGAWPRFHAGAVVDPGAGLEAWRGIVDYWIQPAGPTSEAIGYRGLGLASVSIDGQPPAAWPVTGLRGTLHAWIWFPPAAR
jgi:hypothetical protein